MTQQATKEMVSVTIDGHPMSVEKGITIFEAARKLQKDIPHYCYDPDLTIVASCRLCLVEVEKIPKLIPSCSTLVAEGQVIYTESEKVLEARKMQMEFLLVQHPLDCPVCDQGGECKLQEYSMDHGFDKTRFRYERRTFPKPDIGPFIEIERNRCILCTRCTRYMEEVAGDAELSVVNRGNHAYISTFQDQPLKNEFAGNTIDLCPVGALTSKVTRFRSRPWEHKHCNSVCTLCSVGCSVDLEHRRRTHEVLRIIPRQNDDVNYRWICDIGRFGFDQFNSPNRQRVPLMKNDEGVLEDSKWSRVINRTIDTLKETVQNHGASSIAGIISPRVSNETLYLFQKFVREVIQSNNIDHRTDSEIDGNDDGYLTSLAIGAVNSPFDEVKKSSVILALGADLPNEMPILGLQVRERALNTADFMDPNCRPFTPYSFYHPGADKKKAHVLSANSRPTRMDKDIDQTLQYRPGTESAFTAALLVAVAQAKGAQVPESARSVTDGFDLNAALEKCGVQREAFDQLVKTLVDGTRATILAGQSLYHGKKGVENVIIAGALAQLLKVDGECLPLSILLPYNNSRGAADLGLYPHRAPGYKALEKPGKNTTEILQGCVDGSIKALILFNTDIVNDYPDRELVTKALETVPFVAVADAYPFETQKYASVFMPVSVYSEEDGTYTNVSGQVQRAEKALDQLDGTLTSYQTLLALGERWGCGWKQMDSRKLLSRISEGVAHYSGMTWDSIGALGQQSQPVDATLFTGTEKKSSFTLASANGQVPEGQFRLVRGPYLFDTHAEKRYAQPLVERSEPCVAEINPDDAKRISVSNGESIKIVGEKGSLELPVRVSAATFAGCVSVLGTYENLPLNGIAPEKSPWVKIQK